MLIHSVLVKANIVRDLMRSFSERRCAATQYTTGQIEPQELAAPQSFTLKQSPAIFATMRHVLNAAAAQFF